MSIGHFILNAQAAKSILTWQKLMMTTFLAEPYSLTNGIRLSEKMFAVPAVCTISKLTKWNTDMSDLIKRLRSGDEIHEGNWSMLDEAAEKIEAQEKEIAELKEENLEQVKTIRRINTA